MTETKHDVFKMALDEWKQNFISSLPRDGSFEDWSESLSDYSARYDASLPDDLPVIPKAVGEYIKRWKADLLTEPLFVIFLTIQHNMNIDNPPDFEAQNWIIDHGDTFARAWLDGAWRVEGTGEIVKLEEEK